MTGIRLSSRTTRRLTSSLAVLVLVVLATGCDWLQTDFDAGNSNYSPSEPALNATTVGSLTEQFRLSAPTSPLTTYGIPIVAGGTLYDISWITGTDSSISVFAADASTGAPRWSTPLPGTGVASSWPIAAGNSVFVVTDESGSSIGSAPPTTVYALSAATGQIEWSTQLPVGINGAKLISDGGRVFVGLFQQGSFLDGQGSSYWAALDASTGAIDWTKTTGANSSANTGSLAADGNGHLVLNYLACASCSAANPITSVVDEATGSVEWSSSSETNETLDVAANRLLYGTGFDPSTQQFGTIAVDPATGTRVWSGALPSPQAVTGKLGIAMTSSGGLVAVNQANGSPVWSAPPPTGAVQWDPPTVAGNLVYTMTGDALGRAGTWTLHTYDLATGAPVSTMALPVTPYPYRFVVVAEGHVYAWAQTTIVAYAPT